MCCVLDVYEAFPLTSLEVANGLLLAFFHAIRDKDPVSNNDPTRRNDEWSNFCGTAQMGEDVGVSTDLNSPLSTL